MAGLRTSQNNNNINVIINARSYLPYVDADKPGIRLQADVTSAINFLFAIFGKKSPSGNCHTVKAWLTTKKT